MILSLAQAGSCASPLSLSVEDGHEGPRGPRALGTDPRQEKAPVPPGAWARGSPGICFKPNDKPPGNSGRLWEKDPQLLPRFLSPDLSIPSDLSWKERALALPSTTFIPTGDNCVCVRVCVCVREREGGRHREAICTQSSLFVPSSFGI